MDVFVCTGQFEQRVLGSLSLFVKFAVCL